MVTPYPIPPPRIYVRFTNITEGISNFIVKANSGSSLHLEDAK